MLLFEVWGARKNVHTKKCLLKTAAYVYLDHISMGNIANFMWGKLTGLNLFIEKHNT